MTRSEAWADLGGQLPQPADDAARQTPARAATSPRAGRHVHAFSTSSGWCDCGLRDTGETCPFSPAAQRQQATSAATRGGARHAYA